MLDGSEEALNMCWGKFALFHTTVEGIYIFQLSSFRVSLQFQENTPMHS
jgi:hypothetical protein